MYKKFMNFVKHKENGVSIVGFAAAMIVFVVMVYIIFVLIKYLLIPLFR